MNSGYLKINVASVKDNRAAIYFKYNEAAVSILKSAVPQNGRRFCRENKTWDVDIQSFPSLVKMFAECSVGGMYFECSSLISIYQKYCESHGIDCPFSRMDGMIPVQPELFDAKTAEKKPYPMNEILPSGFYKDPDIAGFVPEIPEGSSFSPYPHQVSGAAVLLKNHKYILADTMGLGKTFTAILAAYGTKGRKLIVTPASLKLNWRNEIMKFGIPEEDICVISSKTVSEDLKNNAEWAVVNYDSLRCALLQSSQRERRSRQHPQPFVA